MPSCQSISRYSYSVPVKFCGKGHPADTSQTIPNEPQGSIWWQYTSLSFLFPSNELRQKKKKVLKFIKWLPKSSSMQ